MNRFNFGNQITNGMQILSVAGTTAAKAFNKKEAEFREKYNASNALNNMSLDEAKQVGEMRAQQLRDELAQFNENNELKNKTKMSNPLSHLSDEESKQYGELKANEIRKKLSDDDIDIDEIMSSTPLKTQELRNVSRKIDNDMSWSNFWKDIKDSQIDGFDIKDFVIKQKKDEEEGENNANNR